MMKMIMVTVMVMKMVNNSGNMLTMVLTAAMNDTNDGGHDCEDDDNNFNNYSDNGGR